MRNLQIIRSLGISILLWNLWW